MYGDTSSNSDAIILLEVDWKLIKKMHMGKEFIG